MEKIIDFSQLPTLHLGPMSRNVIDAAVSFATKKSWPICLIASRRQIDSADLGGGYVGGLSTEQFAKNLSEATASGHIILARDHGGPYQRSEEQPLLLEEALDQVERSFRADIESGFNIIHIDPEKCIMPGDPNGLRLFTELTCELIARCNRILAETKRKNVRFEVGSDEGIGMEFVPDQWAQFLEDVKAFCTKEGCPEPIAIAVPLGTKVKETTNVGGLALNLQDPFWIKRVQAMQEVADRFGVKLKLHNADYVREEVLKLYRELGVAQINVAPELGVIETRALLHFLRHNQMEKQADAFLDIALKSKKWERWLLDESKATDEEKAIIAGHYIFATPLYKDLLKDIQTHPAARGLDSYLVSEISKGIDYYYTLLEDAHAPLQHVSA